MRSLDDSFHIRIVNSAHGSTRFTADTTAAAIRINIAQTESVVTIDQGIFITKKQKFRNQQVAVLISVPVGKSISLPKSNSVSNYNDNVWEFQNWHNESKTNQEFLMTDEGLRSTEDLENVFPIPPAPPQPPMPPMPPISPERPKNKKMDSLIELKKKLELEINKQNAVQDTI